MASFDILYRGDQSGFKIPEFDKLESAEKDFYGNIIKGAETEYLKKEKDEADFLGMMKTNPVLLISDKTRTMQAEAIEKYNNKWASTLAKKQGSLNLKDKMEMQRDKEALGMFQNTLLSDQQRYQSEFDIMRKDTRGYYDPEYFNQAQKQMFDEGKYPATGLMPKPQDILRAILNDKMDFGEEPLKPITDANGMIRSATANMTVDQARYLVRKKALENSAYMRNVIEEFDRQPESEQLKYLDANQNGIIDPSEKRTPLDEPTNMNNPILLWAQDYYAPKVRKINYGEPKGIPGTSRGGGLSIIFPGGKEVKYTPPTATPYALSNDKYSNEFYSFAFKDPISFKLGPTAIEIDSGIELPIDKGKAVNAFIEGYDYEGGYVLLQPGTSRSDINRSKTIIVPLKDIITQIPELKINKDGKIISITANTKSTEPKQPTKDWSKYKR